MIKCNKWMSPISIFLTLLPGVPGSESMAEGEVGCSDILGSVRKDIQVGVQCRGNFINIQNARASKKLLPCFGKLYCYVSQ